MANQEVSQTSMIHVIESPAGSPSGQPNLHATRDGRVYLTWIESKGEDRHALRFSSRTEHGWSAPQTIAEGGNWFVNWADFPSAVALPGGALVAHWLVKSSTGTSSYDVHISRSDDGGKTWSKAIVPHRDGTKTEHGFVSLLPWAEGKVGAAWLDGRNMKSDSHDNHGHAAGDMSLRFTTIGRDSRTSEEVLLDSRVCECCQTSAALTSDGAIVAYRDRSEKEIRDIAVVRYKQGQWTKPQTVSADGWHIEGCPVNGPSVAADGQRVAVAWFTAANENPRVKVAFSNDSGASFGRPIQVDDSSPVGRVDIGMLIDGSALVSWLERTSKGGEVKVRRIKSDGSRSQSLTVAESSATRVSGFSQMAIARDEAIFAWTLPGTPARIQTVMIKVKNLSFGL
jgi:hypothetical protein